MTSSSKLGPTRSDLFFLGFLIVNLCVVAYLGKDLYQVAINVEKAKAQGEVYLAWADEFNKNIDATPGPTPKSCFPKEKAEKEKAERKERNETRFLVDMIRKRLMEKGCLFVVKEIASSTQIMQKL